ncbi:MAG: hypothetical protein FJ022_05640 [Chloroflexi bacterium]|nr:hypothetical protein [Chloroflexota bacterium]
MPIYTGLEYVGLALIFLPEPTTTFIGVGLLGYARSKKMGQEPQPVHRRAHFSDIYSYNVKMKDSSAIHYHITGIREGQMPRKWPVTYKLHTADHISESHLRTKNNVIYALPSRREVTALREGLIARRTIHAQPTRKQFSGLQEGLLANRVAGAGYAGSVAARHAPRHKWAT